VSSRVTALAELLRSRREQAGYSRTRAAELSGVNASSIETWESGRVSKPPIHDVLKLARVLSISIRDVERAVMDENDADAGAASGGEADSGSPSLASGTSTLPLLERAMVLLDWTDEDAAAALNTTPDRVQGLRVGEDQLSGLEVMALIAVLAAFPSGRGGATKTEVQRLLAQLRGTRCLRP
jgi:transcriptional regulator with XRE-family HTH domain